MSAIGHRTRSGMPDQRFVDSRRVDPGVVREVACPTCPAAQGEHCMAYNGGGGTPIRWSPKFGAVTEHKARRRLAEALMACALAAVSPTGDVRS